MSRFIPILILFLVSCEAKNNIPNGLVPIKENGKWGFINSEGEKVIRCQFDSVGPFSEGLASIKWDSLYGFIDTMGKIVIQPMFRDVCYAFSDGLSKVEIQTDTGLQQAFIRVDGSIAFFTSYKDVYNFQFGRAVVNVKDEVCFMDKTGEIVFNTHYPYCDWDGFKEGIAQVWGGHRRLVQEGLSQTVEGDTTKYYDTGGNVVITLDGMGFNDFSEGLACVKINNENCYIDKTGKIKIKPKIRDLDFCMSFSDGLAMVGYAGPDHKAGFIDKTGNIVIPIIFYHIDDFKEGVAAFKDKGGWGFIDKRGRIVLPPQYDAISSHGFEHGLCIVWKGGKCGYINHKGVFVWFESIDLLKREPYFVNVVF